MKPPRFFIRDLLLLTVVVALLVVVWAQWLNIRSHRNSAEVYTEAYQSGFKRGWRERGIQFGVPKDQLDVLPPRRVNPTLR